MANCMGNTTCPKVCNACSLKVENTNIHSSYVICVSAEVAYHLKRSRERQKHVQLKIDMFSLTFIIYGGMILVALMVFIGEVLIGKQTMKMEANEANTRNKNDVPTLVEQAANDNEEAIENGEGKISTGTTEPVDRTDEADKIEVIEIIDNS